ncbi:diguanylate cyclase with PAS/PAC sensor [Thermodesulfobium narugense DSM 14796]|uniref:diguanylate cyclase n=1 Tax=Thermodesulfobium narugense DSM 14796 TaxID=747365 RepID=M1E4B9_9BACT|nr:diguanylate cyclase [Thermodesulfobium narugense]AEE13967.1 diguanylate cyclase with PAS/PAC sensor [Thermodesulfobium narugense DSM 14796]
MSIKNYLKVIIIFLIITPLIVLTLVGTNLYNETRNRTINELIQETSLKQFTLQSYLKKYIDLLNILSANISLANNNYERISYLFRGLSTDDEIENLFFINPDGYSMVEISGPHHVSFNNNNLFKKAIGGNEDFLIQNDGLNSYLYLSKPVYNNANQISGVVLAVVKLTKLESLLNVQNSIVTRSTFLFSNDFIILGNKTKKMPEDLYKKINFSSGYGLVNYRGDSGKNFILFWKNIPNINLAIASQVDEGYIFQEFEQDFAIILFTFLIIFITSLIISIIMIKKLNEPIIFLQSLSKQIKDGNYKIRVEKSFIDSFPEEFKPLLILYNQMSSSIENYVSMLNERTKALEKSEARYKAVVEDQTDLLCRFSHDGTISFANEEFKKFFGLEDLKVYNFFDLFGSNKDNIKNLIESLSIENPHKSIELSFEKDNIKRYFDWTFRIIYKDDVKEFQCTGHDISEIKRLEEELRYQSFHDSLTGLFNRAYFEEELEKLSSGRFSPTSLIIVDLDNLKLVNDKLGHEKGDLLIKKAAKILSSTFRSTDTVSRIGGDEFAILLPMCTKDCTKELIKRLKENIEKANQEKDNLYLSMSIGYATKEGPFNKIEIFREADSYMYLDKQHHHEQSKEITIERIEGLKNN